MKPGRAHARYPRLRRPVGRGRSSSTPRRRRTAPGTTASRSTSCAGSSSCPRTGASTSRASGRTRSPTSRLAGGLHSAHGRPQGRPEEFGPAHPRPPRPAGGGRRRLSEHGGGEGRADRALQDRLRGGAQLRPLPAARDGERDGAGARRRRRGARGVGRDAGPGHGAVPRAPERRRPVAPRGRAAAAEPGERRLSAAAGQRARQPALARRGPARPAGADGSPVPGGDVGRRSPPARSGWAEDLEFEIGQKEALAVWYERGVLAAAAALALFWVLLTAQQRLGQRRAARRRADGAGDAPEGRPGHALSRGSLGANRPRTAPPPNPSRPPSRAAGSENGARRRRAPNRLLPRRRPSFRRRRPGPACRRIPAWRSAPRPRSRRGSSPGTSPTTSPRRRTGSPPTWASSAWRRTGCAAPCRTPTSASIRSNGADFDEEMETSSAIASSVGREANAIADLAKRLGAYAQRPNGLDERGMVDINACIDEVIKAVGAEAAADGGAEARRHPGRLRLQGRAAPDAGEDHRERDGRPSRP